MYLRQHLKTLSPQRIEVGFFYVLLRQIRDGPDVKAIFVVNPSAWGSVILVLVLLLFLLLVWILPQLGHIAEFAVCGSSRFQWQKQNVTTAFFMPTNLRG